MVDPGKAAQNQWGWCKVAHRGVGLAAIKVLICTSKRPPILDSRKFPDDDSGHKTRELEVITWRTISERPVVVCKSHCRVTCTIAMKVRWLFLISWGALVPMPCTAQEREDSHDLGSITVPMQSQVLKQIIPYNPTGADTRPSAAALSFIITNPWCMITTSLTQLGTRNN
jgi:hypothetical protein